MGLLFDQVKQGIDTTNNGNIARRFFADPSLSASITKLNRNKIERFNIIFQVICCGNSVNVQKFHDYCTDTAKELINSYEWYFMPATVHKLLIHGSKIISEAALPVGIFFEEAQKARNKVTDTTENTILGKYRELPLMRIFYTFS